MMTQKYDIFISYRREGGEDAARKIQLELEKGYRVFLDFDELKDGKFDQRIMDAISDAPVFLLVLSRGALDRCKNEDDWVRKEILYAKEQDKHIVPVNVDGAFNVVPNNIDADVWKIVGAHQFSEVQTKTLFKSSMRELIKNRIEPNVPHATSAQSGAEIHIEVDADCTLYRFKEKLADLRAGDDNVVRLMPGNHRLRFVSAEFSDVETTMQRFNVPSENYSDIVDILLLSQVQAKRKELEEARKYREAELVETKRKQEKETLIKEGKMLFEQAKAYDKKGDYTNFIKFLTEAATKGYSEAQVELGVKYEVGLHVKKSPTIAIEWYLRAAEQEYVPAQLCLADCYYRLGNVLGKGVKESRDEAINWYRKAAENGHPRGQFYTGWLLDDEKEKVKWYYKAATQGHTEAQFYLAESYYTGEGISQDYKEAYKWYLEAAQKGYGRAQARLGYMYQWGQGATRDFGQALMWYKKAINNDEDYAKYYLGFMYYYGQGVQKDEDEAIRWWKKAADEGLEEAEEKIKSLSLYKRMKYGIF